MVQIVVSDLGTIKLAQQSLKGMPAKVKRAVRNAAVDTIRAVKAEIPRSVNARYDITKSEVRRQMTLRTVSEDGGMRTGLIIEGRRILWKCDCGALIERDPNAALNIRDEAIKNLVPTDRGEFTLRESVSL
jgi:hypothetical protein